MKGGAAVGDIGGHIPETDGRFKGGDWRARLAEAGRGVGGAGYEIGNVDATIVAQAPKMVPHIGAMREKLAAALAVAYGQVNVKAKTAEKMGPVGRGESIEARAVCLIVRV